MKRFSKSTLLYVLIGSFSVLSAEAAGQPTLNTLEALAISPKNADPAYDGSTGGPAGQAGVIQAPAPRLIASSLIAATPAAGGTHEPPAPAKQGQCEPFKEWYPGFGAAVGYVAGTILGIAAVAAFLAGTGILGSAPVLGIFLSGGILTSVIALGGAIGRLIGMAAC